jgi:hypothetical protein
MTLAEVHGPREGRGDAALGTDLRDLRAALAAHPFPARQDDLIAACLGQGAPARLCCRLATLDHDTEYADVDEVLCAVAARAEASSPG